jgi:hypothetical protein
MVVKEYGGSCKPIGGRQTGDIDATIDTSCELFK